MNILHIDMVSASKPDIFLFCRQPKCKNFHPVSVFAQKCTK